MVEVENNIQKYPAYKDSGVEWLGEIPESWEIIKLKFISKIFNGDSLNEKKKLDYEINNDLKKGLPYISTKDINYEFSTIEYENGLEVPKENNKLKIAPKDSFLLCIEGGSAGKKIGYLSQDVCFVNKLACFQNQENSNSKYLYYFSKSLAFQSQFQLSMTGLIGGVSISLIRNFDSYLPPFEEQTAIAQFLDDKTTKIDDAIAIKRLQIKLLRERKQILIHKAVTQGLNPNVKLKDSGVEWVGEIPVHWEVKRLKYILKTQGRIGFKGYTTSDLVDKKEGALTFGASHLDWGGNIILEKPVYINWKKYYESPEIMVSKNDVLIVQRGSTCGKVALVDKDYGPTTINPSLVLLKEIRGNSSYIFLGIKVVLNGILNLVSKTAIPMLTQFQIDNIEIPLPSLIEQKEISAYIESTSYKIETAINLKQQEIAKLKEYKSSLINSAVTGKIKVC